MSPDRFPLPVTITVLCLRCGGAEHAVFGHDPDLWYYCQDEKRSIEDSMVVRVYKIAQG